jgi:cation:H+ antiporter
MALGSLISSKLNQWTLLVGMIPGVFAVSHGSLDHPLPMDSLQMHEIFLTAAQSLMAVVLLASMRLGLGGAILLFVLFSGQLVLPSVVKAYPSMFFGLVPEQVHPLFSAFYVVVAAALFLRRPSALWHLSGGLRAEEEA